MNNKIFFLFLLVAGLSLALANEQPDLHGMPETNVPSKGEYVYLVELDSIDIYKELIELEDKESSCAMDIVGIVVGGGITGLGATLVGFGLYAMFSNSDPQSLDESSKGFAGGLIILASVPVLLLGIPVLLNNIGDYKVHKKHALKRDEYKEALDRYKVRMQEEGWKSVQLMVVPTLNLAKASFGANAVLQF
jgi:hypothetical protein